MLAPRELSDAAIVATFGPPSGAAGGIMFLLFLLYFISTGMVQYVYGYVVATLAMVEEPTPSVLIHSTPVDDNDPDAPLPPYTDNKEDDIKENDIKEPLIRQEVLLVKHKPITASIRGTVRHLKSRGARPFRGAGIALLCLVLTHIITHVSMFLLPSMTGMLVGPLAAMVLLTRLSMLWTHVVISEPNPNKKWHQRIVPRSVARKAILPTFLVGAAISVGLPLVPGVLFHLLRLDRDMRPGTPPNEISPAHAAAVAAKSLFVVVSTLAYVLFVCVPLTVALTRCYAALLPADETPIVPMDRTFGGLFVSEADGGKGRLTLKEAWKSFDWNGRVRLVKVFVKVTGLVMLMTVGFFAASFGVVTLF